MAESRANNGSTQYKKPYHHAIHPKQWTDPLYTADEKADLVRQRFSDGISGKACQRYFLANRIEDLLLSNAFMMFNLFVRLFIRLRVPYVVFWGDDILVASVKLSRRQTLRMFMLTRQERKELLIIEKYISRYECKNFLTMHSSYLYKAKKRGTIKPLTYQQYKKQVVTRLKKKGNRMTEILG